MREQPRKTFTKYLVQSRSAILFFLVFSLLQGSFFIEAVGALSFPDPNIHAYASYALATGQILNRPEQQYDNFGNKIKVQHLTGDSRFLDLTGCYNVLVAGIFINPSSRDTNIETQRKVNQQTSGKEITVPSSIHQNRANQYFPVIYLPQAMGVWLGLHTHQPPYRTWQFGRLSNLLIYILLFCMAITIIPKNKLFLAVVGILPPNMFIASSLMSDSLFISLSACFIALFLSITTHHGQATRKEMIAISIMTVLLFMCKIVYACLAILILVLPKNILSTKRKLLYLGISSVISLSIYGLWSSRFATTWADSSISTNLKFMLQHPFRIFLNIAWNLAQEPLRLLRLGAPSIEFVIILGVAWGLLYHNSHLKPYKVIPMQEFISRYRYQITSLIAFVILAYLVYASMLITWNTVPSMGITDQVEGIQARYLEPFLPLLACTAFYSYDEERAENRTTKIQ